MAGGSIGLYEGSPVGVREDFGIVALCRHPGRRCAGFLKREGRRIGGNLAYCRGLRMIIFNL